MKELVDLLATQTTIVTLRVVSRIHFLQWHQEDLRSRREDIMEVQDPSLLPLYEIFQRWGMRLLEAVQLQLQGIRRWVIGTWFHNLHRKQWHWWYNKTLTRIMDISKICFRMEELLQMRKILTMIIHQNGNTWAKVYGRTRTMVLWVILVPWSQPEMTLTMTPCPGITVGAH